MAAAKRGAAAMKLLYEKLRSPPSSMAAAKRGAAAMKLSYEKLRSALPLPCSSPMGLMVSFKLTKLIYGQRGIEELLKKRMEENQKKTEAGSGDEKNEGVMKPTMSPVEMMSTFLVLQGIVDSVLKDVSTVHAVRKETVENAASILWKTATGADVREQKAEVSSILKELRNGNANVEAIAVKIDAVNVKLDTLLGNFNIPIPPTPTPSIAVAVPPPTSSTASPPPPTSSTAPSQPPPPPPTNGDGNGGGTSSTAPPQPPPPPPTNGGGNGGD